MYTLQHKNTGYELTFQYLDYDTSHIIRLRESVSKRLGEIDADVSTIRGDTDICLIINADKIETLTELMRRNWTPSEKYNLLIRVIHGLSSQLIYLIANGLCFYNMTMDDILVVNEKTAVYISPHLLPLAYSTTKKYTYMDLAQIPVHQDNLYASPELRSISKLPAKLPVSSIYWSLAAVIVHCFMFTVPIHKLSCYKETQTQLLLQCSYIRETRMFYLLRRCFEPDHTLRSLLYI